MIRVVIFDLDNTLVDFMRMKRAAVKSAVLAMIDAGLDLTYVEARDRVNRIYDQEGIEYQEVFDHFLREHYGRIDHKILAAAVVGYRRARDAALVLYPHVTSTLTTLVKQGVKLALLTDAPPKQAWLRLTYLNLHHLFDIVVTGEDVGAFKPSPKGFRRVLEVLKASPDEALMVGDWPDRDIRGGKGAGIGTVFARYGGRKVEGASGADYEIDDIKELVGIVGGNDEQRESNLGQMMIEG
ncbi:MAG: TIGR02253 family HAD-type hydrolase [Calditrichaeota bacterium]|nr:TIGR02253 family HAD-type hydrolase [Calditrichota bacterium]